MADLREHLNVYEIMGPKASQIIKGALKPVDDKREDFRKVCVCDAAQGLGKLTCISSGALSIACSLWVPCQKEWWWVSLSMIHA